MTYIRSIGENTIIDLTGKLDYTNATTLMDELKTLTGKGVKRIDFYCKGLEYISSAGIRAMLFCKQKIDKTVELEVYMHNVEHTVEDVFKLSGLDGYFEFVD